MITENDFYIHLYDDFIKINNDENEKILWKMRSIIELMKLTEGNDEGELCENGLRIIMSLFNHYVVYPFDFDNDYFNISSLNQHKQLISILKREFI